MDRRTNRGTSVRLWRGVAPAVLAGVLGWSATALAQTQTQAPANKTISDAQVEANVLKALAGAPDLANQPMTTTTVYGVVTLSGSVQTEALRTEAETIASRTAGVQKVVDEMTLNPDATGARTAEDSGAPAAEAADAQQQGLAQGVPDASGAPGSPNQSPNQASGPYYGPGAPEYRQPYGGQQAAIGQQTPPPPSTATPQPQGGYPGGYGPPTDYGQQQGSPQQPGYPPQQGYPPPQGYAAQPGYNGAPQPVFGGQEAGQMVTVPSGAMVRIRIDEPLDSGHAKPGEHFDGIVVNDVVADGAVAIPRGAAVQGAVIGAKKSGAVSGRGELSLQLTQVTLAGKTYPIASEVWDHHAGEKAVQTVNRTAAGGVIGALIGAAAGGGEGAAIGAGVGGALGLGSSAAAKEQLYIPAEGLLTFHLAQPATVATVSQQEMDRLAQAAGPAAYPQQLQRRYPPPYYGPGYYRPYPYPY